MVASKKPHVLFRRFAHSLKLHYLFYLVLSYFLFAILWHTRVDGIYFYCDDPMPFLDFKPPFVHGSREGDYFIYSKSTVYSLWYLYLLGMFTVPALIVGILRKKRKVIKFTLVSIVIGSILILAESFSHSSSALPEPPPLLTNEKAEYRIVKLGENFAFSYKEANKEELITYVGNSKVDLWPYVGLQVAIQGTYRISDGFICNTTNTQCILGQCHAIFKDKDGSTCAVDIQSVDIKSSK